MKKALLLTFICSGFLFASAQPENDIISDTTFSEKLESLARIVKKQDTELQLLKKENAEMKLELNRLQMEKQKVKRNRKTIVERRGSKQVTIQ